jgi:dTDP-4-dehydrorhamnose reductase
MAVREVTSRHVIVRTAWLYGHGGTNFVDTILARARKGEPLRVVDDQRGSPTSTSDLAQALLKLAGAGQYGTYHCTNAGECTWHDLAVHALARAGLAAPIERIDSATLARPARRPAYSVLSNLMFEHVTGHRMAHWQDAVDRYLGGGAVAPRATEEGR